MSLIRVSICVTALFISFLLNSPEALARQTDEPLPDGALFRIGTHRLRLNSSVKDCSLSDDGKILVAISERGDIARWDTATGKLIGKFVIARNEGTRIQLLSPDGLHFATVDYDGKCHIHESISGQKIHEFESAPNAGGRFLQRGRLFCTYTRNRPIQIWTTSTGEPFPKHCQRNEDGSIRLENGEEFNRFQTFEISGNGILACSTHRPGPIRLWDLKSGKIVRKFELQDEDNTKGGSWLPLTAVSPDGRYVLAQMDHSWSVMFDVETGRELFRINDSLCRHHRFSNDSKSLVACNYKELLIWNVTSGMPVSCPLGIAQEVTCLSLSEDASLAALGTESGTLVVLNTRTGVRLHADAGPENPLTDARFLDGGRLIAAGINGNARATHSGRKVRVWDGLTGNPLDSPLKLAKSLNRISADGRTFIDASNDELTVFSRRKKQALKFEKGLFTGTRYVFPLAINPNGSILVTGQEIEKIRYDFGSRPAERKLQLRNSSTGALLREIATYSSWQDSFYFSPDNRILAGWFEPGSYDHAYKGPPLQFWDIASGKSVVGFGENSTNVGAFAISPNGRLIASTENWTNEPFIRLRELFTGATFARIDDLLDFFGGMAFSPDDSHLAYCRPGGDICIRDLRTNNDVLKLSGHEGRVNSLDFAPDGRRLLSSGEDGTILVWDVARLARTDGIQSSSNKTSEKLIQMLKGPDTGKAFAAIHQLSGMGNQILQSLEKEVVGAVKVAKENAIQSEHITKFIGELESRDFKTRQAATDRLRENGEMAEASLRAALKNSPALETRRRIEQLLASIESGTPLSPTVVFAIRAIEVLELIGTSQSCAVLERLASNGNDARIQQEAKLSLQQLKERLPR